MRIKVLLLSVCCFLLAIGSFAQENYEGTYHSDGSNPEPRAHRRGDDDVYISSPLDKQTVSGDFVLKVDEPSGNPKSIDATMTLDVDHGRDKLVWSGKLTPANNYSVTIDSKKFKPGKYEVKVKYFYERREYDEDIEIYIE